MIDAESLKNIENLHRLKSEGVITEEEFEKSKEKILFGPRTVGAGNRAVSERAATLGGPLPGQDDFVAWITLALKRYSDFTGRSTRTEFWMFQLVYVVLFLFIFLVVSVGVSEPDVGFTAFGFLTLLFGAVALLGLVVPLLAVEVRRFHDQDKSGWFVLLNLVPYVGPIIVLVMMMIEGTSGENAYGPDPWAA